MDNCPAVLYGRGETDDRAERSGKHKGMEQVARAAGPAKSRKNMTDAATAIEQIDKMLRNFLPRKARMCCRKDRLQ